MAGVAGQHGYPPRAFRPAPDRWRPTEEILRTRGIVPGMYVRLPALAGQRPGRGTRVLATHWSGPAVLGPARADRRLPARPRRKAADPPSTRPGTRTPVCAPPDSGCRRC